VKLRVRSAPFEARYEAMRIDNAPPGAEPLLFTGLVGLLLALQSATPAVTVKK